MTCFHLEPAALFCVFTETLVWLKLKCGILPKLGCNDREDVVDHLKKKKSPLGYLVVNEVCI